MRRIPIDRARKRNRVRQGAGMQRVNLDSVDFAVNTDNSTLSSLDEALRRFAAESPEKAKLVELRFFAGPELKEAADAPGISPATAKRLLAYARACLLCELKILKSNLLPW